MSSSSNIFLRRVDEAILRKFASNGFQGKLEYDPKDVIETERWWYVPCDWIGSVGCIVNKDDFYVNWLGSALSLELCFWGHDHGIFCDLLDFAFAPDTDPELARNLVLQFRHMKRNAKGMEPEQPVPCWENEIASAISAEFPLFKRHFAWFAIPAIRQACDENKLRFTSSLSVDGFST